MSSFGEEDDFFGDFVNSASKNSVNHGDVCRDKFSVTKAVTGKNEALPGSDTGLSGSNETVTGSNETVPIPGSHQRTLLLRNTNQYAIINLPNSSIPVRIPVLEELPGSSLVPSGGIEGQPNPLNIDGGIEGQPNPSNIDGGIEGQLGPSVILCSTEGQPGPSHVPNGGIKGQPGPSEILRGRRRPLKRSSSTEGQPGPSHEPDLSVKPSSYHKRVKKYDYYGPLKPGEDPKLKALAKKSSEYREKIRKQLQGISSGKANTPSLPGVQPSCSYDQQSNDYKSEEVHNESDQLRKSMAKTREVLENIGKGRVKDILEALEKRENDDAQLREALEKREKDNAQLRKSLEEFVSVLLKNNPQHCTRCDEQDVIVEEMLNLT